ncbi:MAG: hypothetical protein LJE83_12230 [Gammaproteobacteria bacterium]|nr:hypothetical protein [Gammaproteobacteria bacterium]
MNKSRLDPATSKGKNLSWLTDIDNKYGYRMTIDFKLASACLALFLCDSEQRT